jgi:molecular chaperone GrpE
MMDDELENGQDPADETAAGDLAAKLAETEAALAETKDKLLRALADGENTRKRAMREREEAGRYAATAFAKDMLDIADNLRRALASASEEGEWDEPTRNLLAGVAATERALMAAFERHGIRRLDPQGERFDHNFHQAMYEVADSGQPAGTIVQVLQPGYVLHDRLLRPAMVAVAKGAARDQDNPAEHA